MWSTVVPAAAAAPTTLALLDEYVIFKRTCDVSGQLYTKTVCTMKQDNRTSVVDGNVSKQSRKRVQNIPQGRPTAAVDGRPKFTRPVQHGRPPGHSIMNSSRLPRVRRECVNPSNVSSSFQGRLISTTRKDRVDTQRRRRPNTSMYEVTSPLLRTLQLPP